jgi:hypothetical protein
MRFQYSKLLIQKDKHAKREVTGEIPRWRIEGGSRKHTS